MAVWKSLSEVRLNPNLSNFVLEFAVRLPTLNMGLTGIFGGFGSVERKIGQYLMGPKSSLALQINHLIPCAPIDKRPQNCVSIHLSEVPPSCVNFGKDMGQVT